jgi:hypothetical protein
VGMRRVGDRCRVVRHVGGSGIVNKTESGGGGARPGG